MTTNLPPAGSSTVQPTLKLAYSKPASALSANEMNYRLLADIRLQRHEARDGRFLFVPLKYLTCDGDVTWANLEAGYGRIFPRDSDIIKGRNGTAQEDQSGFVYLKYCRPF